MLCMKHGSVLQKNGLCFPQYKTWPQHSFAAWLLQKRDEKALRHFLTHALEQAQNNACEHVLLSGEDFENCLVDTHLARQFETLAHSVGFTDISWVVVQRKPLDYLRSIYAEQSMYEQCLDLKILANVIAEYGFVSPGGRRYNYSFVFDINKFVTLFKQEVSPHITVMSFKDFVSDFVGKPLLDNWLNAQSIAQLRQEAADIGVQRKKHSEETVELRYAANFLGFQIGDNFHQENLALVEQLVARRMQRSRALWEEIEALFEKV